MAGRKIDKRLGLGYGSAWHLLRCLGWHRAAFTRLIERELGLAPVDWLDFRAGQTGLGYTSGVPVRDAEWTRLDFLDDPEARRAYDAFWPARGSQQNWDAIARGGHEGEREWLLFEAKAHPGEIPSRGTTASEDGGRPKIRAAFVRTLRELGYDEGEAALRAESWLTGYYQHANRLAALHYLTGRGVRARLVFLYFCGDQWPGGVGRPGSKADWQPALRNVHNGLGLKGSSDLERRVHELFVDVDPRHWSLDSCDSPPR